MVVRKIRLLEEKQNKTVDDIKSIKEQISVLHQMIIGRNIANSAHKSHIIEALTTIEKKIMAIQIEKIQSAYSDNN